VARDLPLVGHVPVPARLNFIGDRLRVHFDVTEVKL
jgi:hypothetical protein